MNAEETARQRFDHVRAGLMLDRDGRQLVEVFTGLTNEIQAFEVMQRGHKAVVEARDGVQQLIDYSQRMEDQRSLVLNGIDAAIQKMAELMEEIGRPV